MTKLLFLVSDAPFFVSHRLRIAQDAKAAGYDVIVACPDDETATAKITAQGLTHVPITMRRSNRGLRGEIASFMSIARVLRRVRPDIVHLVTSKPIIYGGILCRQMGIPAIASVTGLGYVFTNPALRARLLKPAVRAGYRFALNHKRSYVIFQNNTDAGMFADNGITRRAHSCFIRGSGVDLTRLTPKPIPDGPPVVIMPSRMLRDKGVDEFVAAADILAQRGVAGRFRLLGDPDPNNPTSFQQDELRGIASRDHMEWLPHTSDIDGALGEAAIVALPSHREGFPKTLIDAAAAGRAAVATDVPGCRDAIVEGKTGLLAALKNPQDLAEKLQRLLEDPKLCAQMGQAARRHAEEAFDIKTVTAKHLLLYAMALSQAPVSDPELTLTPGGDTPG